MGQWMSLLGMHPSSQLEGAVYSDDLREATVRRWYLQHRRNLDFEVAIRSTPKQVEWLGTPIDKDDFLEWTMKRSILH